MHVRFRRWFILFCATFPLLAARAADLQPSAVAAVERLSTFFKATGVFSVTVTSQVIGGPEIGPRPKKSSAITVHKPDQMVAELKENNLVVRLVLDGKILSILTDPPHEYRQTPAPLSVVPLLRNIAPGLDTLVTVDPKEKILEDVSKLTTVGQEKIGEALCDRLRFEQPDSTVDLLLQTGPQPLMRRLILTVANTGTVIDFHLDDWKIEPKLEADAFAFTPPADAKKVDAPPPEKGQPAR